MIQVYTIGFFFFLVQKGAQLYNSFPHHARNIVKGEKKKP